MSNSPCQSRVLNEKKILSTREGDVEYHTTKECGGESIRRIPVDEGDSYMSACLSCFKRYIRRVKEKGFWYGWFDCDYPPEAPVVGSKWYYLTLMKKALEKHEEVEDDTAPEVQESQESQESQEQEVQVQEQEDPEIECLTQGIAQMTIDDTRKSLRKRIKDLKSLAKPGKMTCKEMTAAFKEIDDLRLKIRML